MAQTAAQREYAEERTSAIANPMPLGLIILALTTALVGASFAHFLIPNTFVGVSTVIAPMLIYGGVIQVLAGMWAFRRNHILPATLFSAYGGFLIAFGVLFLPVAGLLIPFGADIVAFNHAIGLLFLCWTICSVVLLVATLRSNMLLMVTLACLSLAYLFLTIGEFANANRALLTIGGWLGILCALIAWYEALAMILRSTRSPYQLPTGESETPPLTSRPGYGREPAI